jgi:hypothetical protein
MQRLAVDDFSLSVGPLATFPLTIPEAQLCAAPPPIWRNLLVDE